MNEVRVDIGAEDRYVACVGRRSIEGNGNRIRLFSSATACAPDSQRPFSFASRSNPFGQNQFAENLEAPFVAEKISFANGQFARQNLNLVPRQRP
jgi:hypothetical protein